MTNSTGKQCCIGNSLAVTAALWLTLSSGLWPAAAHADKLDDAYRLLSVSEAETEFEKAREQQTHNVVLTYAGIVATSTDQELPDRIKQEISRCYQETYAWENFEPGIAALLAESLSATELRLMIDFFSDKSVPPPMIEQFKALIARADEIEQSAIDYMYSQTEGCDRQNVKLIMDYLSAPGS